MNRVTPALLKNSLMVVGLLSGALQLADAAAPSARLSANHPIVGLELDCPAIQHAYPELKRVSLHITESTDGPTIAEFQLFPPTRTNPAQR